MTRTAVIIGGSRGIGAAAARRLSGMGLPVVLTYRQRERRAGEIVRAIRDAGGDADAFQLDICDATAIRDFAAAMRRRGRPIAVLVLSASGGLEPNKSSDYPERVNVDAQEQLLTAFLPLLGSEADILFLTSHEAHFSDVAPVYSPYAVIARSKRRGEDRLRGRAADLIRSGATLHVVSADLVEGTTTAKLLEQRDQGLIDRRRQEVGRLPSPEDVADHLAECCARSWPPGVRTSYIWEPGARYRSLRVANIDRAADGSIVP